MPLSHCLLPDIYSFPISDSLFAIMTSILISCPCKKPFLRMLWTKWAIFHCLTNSSVVLRSFPFTFDHRTTGRVQTLSAPPPSVTGLLSGQHQSQQKQSQQLQSQTQQQVRRLSQSQPHTQQSTSNSVLSNEPLLTAFVADPSRSLSSMRPVGDEASKCEVWFPLMCLLQPLMLVFYHSNE